MLSRSYGPQEPQTTRVLVRLDELNQPGENLKCPAGYKAHVQARPGARLTLGAWHWLRVRCDDVHTARSCQACEAGRAPSVHQS